MERDVELVDIEATRALAQKLAAGLGPGDLVVLEGDLGAGKTTFVGFAARTLGVSEKTPVTSPTFGLVHELAAPIPVVHADLYRIESPEELLEIGLSEIVGRGEAIVFVEWGERFLDLLGTPTLVLRLSLGDGGARRARLEAGSRRGATLIETSTR